MKAIIYKGDDEKNKIVFNKNPAGEWILENKFGIKAKKELVAGLIKDLADLKGEVRAESKLVFGDFAIGDSEGAHIILEADAGKPLIHLVFALSRPNWGKNFVRLEGSEKIVLINEDILSSLGLYAKDAKLDDKNFADFKLFSFDSKAIQKIGVTLNKIPLVLVKKDSSDKNIPAVWSFNGMRPKEEIDAAKVDEFLTSISNMSAQDAVDPNLNIYGFNQALLSVVLEDSQAVKAAHMEVGAYLPAEKVYYVKILPQNQAFKVSESLIQNLKKDKTYFLTPKNTKKNKSR